MRQGIKIDTVLSREGAMEFIPPEYEIHETTTCTTTYRTPLGKKRGTSPFQKYVAEAIKTYQICSDYGSPAVSGGGHYVVGPLPSWSQRLSPFKGPGLVITVDPLEWPMISSGEPGDDDFVPAPPPPARLLTTCAGGANVRKIGGPPAGHWFWESSYSEEKPKPYRKCITVKEQVLKEGTGIYKELPSNNWNATTIDAVKGEDLLTYRDWVIAFTPHIGTQTKFGVFPVREGTPAGGLVGKHLDYFLWAEVEGDRVFFQARYKNSSLPPPSPKTFPFQEGDRISLSKNTNENGRMYYSATINGREVWRTERTVDETWPW